MNLPRKTSRNMQQAGFSLIEILFVLLIFTILMVFGSMVTNSVLRSSELSTSTVTLADKLAQASLESVKTNHPIRVRFYRFTRDLTSPEPRVQAYQMLTLDSESSSYRELDKIIYFSPGVTVHEFRNASTILKLPETTPVTSEGANIVTDPELSTIAPYTYYEFEFRPDGSTNLPKDETWGLVIAHHIENEDETVPPTYRAIGINPFTGAIKRYY